MTEVVVSESEFGHHASLRNDPVALSEEQDSREIVSDLNSVTPNPGGYVISMTVPTRRLDGIVGNMYRDEPDSFSKFTFERGPWSTKVSVMVESVELAVDVVDFLYDCRGWCRACGDPSCSVGHAFTGDEVVHRTEFPSRPSETHQRYDPLADVGLALDENHN